MGFSGQFLCCFFSLTSTAGNVTQQEGLGAERSFESIDAGRDFGDLEAAKVIDYRKHIN